MKRLTLVFMTALIGGVFAAAAFADTGDSASQTPAPPDCASGNDCGCGDNTNCGCCDLCCPELTTCRCFDDCCCLKQCDTTFTGWIEGGIMGNADGPSTHFNGPVTFPDSDRGQLNQFYGVLQRTTDLSKNCGLFVGYDVDFFYGSDFFFTTAAGLDGTKRGNVPRWNTDPDQNYGFAMPQLYFETDYNDFRVKWGHFYTIIGYETVPAIGNFFYTHSYTMQYGEPFTHTGMLASRAINDYWTWSGGIVGGWNDFSLQEGAQFLGGLTYSVKDCTSLAFSIVTGNESDINVPGVAPESNRTMYSIVWSNELSSRLTYVLQHDLGVQQNTLGFNAVDQKTADWFGINQYLFYKINCNWTLGWRFEWFDDPEGYVVTGLRPGNTDARFRFPGDFYETSLGLNYKPNGNFTLRPEVRYDWYHGQSGFTSPAVPGSPPNQPFNDNQDTNQFLFGLDAIYQF
jgi:Putative beta-barrel porin-2, OmpL-like. bbp2